MGNLNPKVSDIGKQPWFIRYFLYIFFVCIVISIIFIVGYIMPFKPFTFKNYATVPSQACPGERVKVTYIGEMQERWWYEVDSMEGTGYWLTPSGVPFDVQPVDKPVNDNAQGEITSPIIRTAPIDVGEYRIGAEIAIKGRMFHIVPVRQPKSATTILSSDQTVEVLPITNERCRSIPVLPVQGG